MVPPRPTVPSPILVEALCSDSNLEMEWLWYACRMPTVAEREYCLKRALHINPNNRSIQDELRRMTTRPNWWFRLSMAVK